MNKMIAPLEFSRNAKMVSGAEAEMLCLSRWAMVHLRLGVRCVDSVCDHGRVGPPASARSPYSLSVVPGSCRDAGTSDGKMACDLAGDALGVLGPSCEVFGVGR